MQLKKDLALIGGLLLVIIGLLIFGGGITPLSMLKPQSATQSSAVSKKSSQVVINTLNVDADIAATSKDQAKGLSGRESMPISKGMLFVFDQPGHYMFWMKDMKFALDMIWMDENKKVIFISKDASPEPGKKDSELLRYTPSDQQAQVKYVLEVNAGLSDLNHVQIGDTAQFQL